MYISKKKTYKILACAMSAIFVGGFSDVAFAEEVNITEENTTIGEEHLNGGKLSTGDLSNNIFNIYSGTISGKRIHAGQISTGNIFNNKLNVYGGNINGGWLSGAYISSNGTASNNSTNISGGTINVSYIEGSWGYGTHNNNYVDISGGNVTSPIISGAWVESNTTATGNGVYIKGGIVNGNEITGAYMQSAGNAVGNFVNINGGEISGTIYGGWAPNGDAIDNEINIYGNPNLINAILIAGKGISDDAVSNNILKIHTKDLKVKDIQGFENLNFYLPADTAAGNTILTVTNPTKKISNYMYVYKDKALNLNDDATITLITTTDETNGLNLGEVQPTDQNDSDYLKITKVPVSKENPNIIKSLTINAKDITRITPEEEDEENKMKANNGGEGSQESAIFNEPIADSVSLLDSGTDRILEWLPPEGVDYMNSSPTAGYDPFIGIGGSSLKIDTGNGTKLKTKSGGINFGMTRYLKNRHGIFIIAPVVDYGQDSYESTLPDANQTKGSGNSRYFTAGIIARQVSVNGMYYEASLRYGRLRTNFTSNNFLVYGQPTTASYEASTPCYSGHVRIGWRNHISPKNILDVYGVYSMNRINGFTTKVSTGEDYSFSSVSSGRIRIGARFTRELKERESVYSNLAYIHEFTGETVGEYMGMNTPRASLKGSAGLIELGWQVKPAKNSVAMLDTSLALWVGDRKGFTFSTKFKKEF